MDDIASQGSPISSVSLADIQAMYIGMTSRDERKADEELVELNGGPFDGEYAIAGATQNYHIGGCQSFVQVSCVLHFYRRTIWKTSEGRVVFRWERA